MLEAVQHLLHSYLNSVQTATASPSYQESGDYPNRHRNGRYGNGNSKRHTDHRSDASGSDQRSTTVQVRPPGVVEVGDELNVARVIDTDDLRTYFPCPRERICPSPHAEFPFDGREEISPGFPGRLVRETPPNRQQLILRHPVVQGL